MIRVSSFLLLTLGKSGTKHLGATEIMVHLTARVHNQFPFLSCSPPSGLYSAFLWLTKASKLQVLTCCDSQRPLLLKQHTINTTMNFYTVLKKALYEVKQLLVCWCSAWGTKAGMGEETCLRSHQGIKGMALKKQQSSSTRSRETPKPAPPASCSLDPIAC